MKMKVLLLRDVAVTLVSTVSLLVIVGSIMNMHNDKYSRSRNTSCSHGILILNQPDSHVCCTSMDHSHSWICSASFDVLNSVISSKWAFFIPLLPLLANVVFANGWNGNGWYRRLGVYLALFLLRTVRVTAIIFFRCALCCQLNICLLLPNCVCRLYCT